MDGGCWNVIVNHRRSAAAAITSERIEPFELDVRPF
jgi:hypothetical protein